MKFFIVVCVATGVITMSTAKMEKKMGCHFNISSQDGMRMFLSLHIRKIKKGSITARNNKKFFIMF